MEPETRLELVHFQLTKNCNLRCWFCGQWGKNGFFADTSGQAMQYADWVKVVRSLVEYRDRTGIIPSVMLWGGEPLMYPQFDDIARLLHREGFPLGMITNGTQIHLHADVCNECFEKIYFSVDGNREIHDSIRGNGVFDTIIRNRKLLTNPKLKIILMSVLTDAIQADLEGHIKAMEVFCPDELILQEMIGLSESEIGDYKDWMKTAFQKEATDIDGWLCEKEPQSALWIMNKLPQWNERAPFKVSYLPHGQATGKAYCLSPWRHAHIAWNGNVLFCTDFYDFSAGNVRDSSLLEIWENPVTEHYRREIMQGHCVTCEHCSWRNSEKFN